MFIVALCIVALAVGSPIVAAIVVSIASRREDANWSVGRPSCNLLDGIARRIVAFDADSIVWPRSKAQVQAEKAQRALIREHFEREEAEARNRRAA